VRIASSEPRETARPGDEDLRHDAGTQKRQISDLSLPLAIEAAFDKQEQIIDCAADGYGGTDLEHSGHGPSRLNTVVRVLA
jgi:hypothetical protein